jgi:seryl-tRNA synthetase
VIDINILRTEPETLRHSLRRRGVDLDVDLLADLDARIRRTRQEAEETRARQKESGKTIAGLQGTDRPPSKPRPSCLNGSKRCRRWPRSSSFASMPCG